MTTPQKLSMVMVFDSDPETGQLFAVDEPIQCDSSEKAVRIAQNLADKHAGIIAWSRSAVPDLSEYGEPELLFQAGEIGDME